MEYSKDLEFSKVLLEKFPEKLEEFTEKLKEAFRRRGISGGTVRGIA